MRLGIKVGRGCTALMDAKMRNLDCTRLEMDEIWGFVGKKERHLRPFVEYRGGNIRSRHNQSLLDGNADHWQWRMLGNDPGRQPGQRDHRRVNHEHDAGQRVWQLQPGDR